MNNVFKNENYSIKKVKSNEAIIKITSDLKGFIIQVFWDKKAAIATRIKIEVPVNPGQKLSTKFVYDVSVKNGISGFNKYGALNCINAILGTYDVFLPKIFGLPIA
jgi:hypothetical protein